MLSLSPPQFSLPPPALDFFLFPVAPRSDSNVLSVPTVYLLYLQFPVRVLILGFPNGCTRNSIDFTWSCPRPYLSLLDFSLAPPFFSICLAGRTFFLGLAFPLLTRLDLQVASYISEPRV